MARLYAEIAAPDKSRRESLASNDCLYVALYNGNKKMADIAFTGDTATVNDTELKLKG